MRVKVRLYAGLADRVADRQALLEDGIELPETATVSDLFASLDLTEREVQLIIVDGRIVHDRETRLRDGARVALFPPVGGG